MAGEVQQAYETGRTVYFLVRNRNAQVWHTLSGEFQNYATANYSHYDISMTEQGSASAFFAGTFPSAIPAGVYNLQTKNQTGGSPAETDPTIQTARYDWDGGNTLPLADLTTSGQLGDNLPVRPTRGVAISGFVFNMVSAADKISPFTSGVISGQISKDGGSFGALQSGAFTEIGLGFYSVNLTSGDMNAQTVGLSFSAVGISGGTAVNRNYDFLLQKASG